MENIFKKIAAALLLLLLLSISSWSNAQAASAPDWSNQACYGSGNPLSAEYKYQCTWYVWGRVRECLGIKMSGKTSQYVNSSVTGGYSNTPSAGSVAVYTNEAGSILHVAYIEAFDGNTITYSEGNNVSLGTGVQRYYTKTLSLSNFISQTKKWVGNGCSIIKYVPLISEGTGQTPSVTVSTGTADNITSTNAMLHGAVTKTAGTWISSCGIYLGTNIESMTKRNTETVGSAANNKDGGTGFDIWYDLGSELSITLSQNTTYYYLVYAICGNQEIRGEVKSFQTKGGTVVYDQNVQVDVPANYMVQGYETVESAVNYRKIDPQAEPYTIYATKFAALSSGGRRFYFTDSQGNGIWFDDSSQYTVTYCVSSILTEVSEVTVPVGETAAVRFSCNPSGYTETLKTFSQLSCPAVIEGNQLVIQGAAPIRNAAVRLYASTSGTGTSVLVTVVDDSSPEISNITIDDIDASGFTVSWEAEDNYRLDALGTQILAWSAQEGEEQAKAAEITEIKEESDKKMLCQAYVRTADHDGAAGEYFFRIRAMDASGNIYRVAGSVDIPCGHLTQEQRGRKDAGCVADGYTGDRVCAACGEVLQSGAGIPATGHKWDSGRITLEATNDKEGEKTFACTICGETKTERIPSTGGTKTDTDEPRAGEIFQDQIFTYTIVSCSDGQGEAELSDLSNKSISSIRIPQTVRYKTAVLNVTSIGNKALKGCKKLKTVTIGKNVTVIGKEAFCSCTGLTSVKGGSGLTEIGIKAFYGCASLKKVTLASKKLVSIKGFAFAKCTSLSSFQSVSAKLSYIGQKAFWSDKKLNAVTLKTKKLTKSRVGAKAFLGIGSKCKIKVPAKSVKTYQKLIRAKGAGKQVIVIGG